jgi:hypothetical protein
MACTRWANFDESAVEVDVAGCGAARQWSPATKSPVDAACKMVLRVGLRSHESGRAHLRSARQAFAKARNR